jgi:hypothetical protein
MAIRDFGQSKTDAVERFKGILDLRVKGSLKTNSPVPIGLSRESRKRGTSIEDSCFSSAR